MDLFYYICIRKQNNKKLTIMAKGKNFKRKDGYRYENNYGFTYETIKTTNAVMKRMIKFDIRPKK